MGFIPNKYASSKCRKCGKGNAIGESVWYTRDVKGVLCAACHGQAPNVPPAPAPASYGSPAAPTALSGTPLQLPANVGEGSHVVRVWESFSAYVESAKSTTPVANEPCWYSSKRKFYGTDSWDEAIGLAERGWDSVRPQVDALVANIEHKIAPSIQPAFTSYFDVSGGAVDIGRFLDGEPECMVETRLVEIAKPGRVITLLINGGVLSAASTDDIIERGCAIVALVDSLERMQHAVELWIEMSCAREFGGKPSKMPVLTHLVKLKNAGQALDIDSLMFAVANPARHRRLTFALRRNEPNRAKYGIPEEATCPVTQSDRVGATMVLESLSHNGRTVSAEEWIMTTLSEFGLVKEGG